MTTKWEVTINVMVEAETRHEAWHKGQDVAEEIDGEGYVLAVALEAEVD